MEQEGSWKGERLEREEFGQRRNSSKYGFDRIVDVVFDEVAVGMVNGIVDRITDGKCDGMICGALSVE